jgi:hypothetical protein
MVIEESNQNADDHLSEETNLFQGSPERVRSENNKQVTMFFFCHGELWI